MATTTQTTTATATAPNAAGDLNLTPPDPVPMIVPGKAAGLAIHLQDPNLDERPLPLDVRRPSSFRSLFYRALTLAGLRRNSAGGFGGIIPLQITARPGYSGCAVRICSSWAAPTR